MGGLLRAAPILGRCVRNEAAVCKARRPRRSAGAAARGSADLQGARAGISAHGSGHDRGYDRGPGSVSFIGVSGHRTLLLQSYGGSLLYGIGFGNCYQWRAARMRTAAFLPAAMAVSAWLSAVPAAADQGLGAAQGLTLEKIMADPDWIGAMVKKPFWAADGRAVYYSAKRSGSPILD